MLSINIFVFSANRVNLLLGGVMFSAATGQKYWVSTVSREHVLVGVKGKFSQVCHGKKGPLARMKKGDWIIYYSPKISMSEKAQCQRFTAIGKIADDTIYQFKMSENFIPFRRNVNYLNEAREQPIRPLLDELSFTQGKKNWGAVFCFGIFQIPQSDFDLIYQKMIGEEKPLRKRKAEESQDSDSILIEEIKTDEDLPPDHMHKKLRLTEESEKTDKNKTK